MRLMGIVNTTPDSFFVGSRALESQGVARALQLVAEGADLLDIGGESTRPGSDPVDADEEIRRVLPVLRGLSEAGCPVPRSIDTRKYLTAKAAFEAGATWLNDVSALADDSRLGPFAAETGMTVVLMHRQGSSAVMQHAPHYADVVADVVEALSRRVEAALAWGIPPVRLYLDPGIGFGKTLAHTLDLLQGLPRLAALGFPLLVGLSRKSFLAKIDEAAGVTPSTAATRLPGSLAGALAMAEQGVAVLRVHDVAETAQALRAWSALRRRGDS